MTKLQITNEVETITPQKAKTMLVDNTRNRGVKRELIRRYKEDMLANRWHLVGAPIVLASDGTILDGQHRLLACVQSGVSFAAYVMRNVPKEHQVAIDTGKSRGLKDVLHIRGETNFSSLAAAVNAHWKWSNNYVLNWGVAPTIQQALDWLDANPGLRTSFDAARPLHYRPLMMPASVATPFAYEAFKIDHELASEFIESVSQRSGNGNSDPTIKLYDWFLKRSQRRHERGRPGPVVCLAIAIKAWNAYVAGNDVTFLVWRRAGKQAEPFPKMNEPI